MPLNFLRKQNYKQITKLHAVANATYEISVVSYTYMRHEYNVERTISKQLNGASKTTLLRQRTAFVATETSAE